MSFIFTTITRIGQCYLGLPSEALAARISTISGILAETHFRALQKRDAAANPYMTTVFDNAYATSFAEAGLPLYLQQNGQEMLRRTGIEIRLHLAAAISYRWHRHWQRSRVVSI